MATIYFNCRDYDKMITELDELLALGTVYTVNDVKIDPDLAPLRELPRFQELIRKYEPGPGS